ncbi:response regulator transcription factor [Planomicrobium sp. YIM 101495]|uniref:response regulator transcription factor n=1 Tax=Planomicrobium sp. YIM 101495 TaxID=2665160 RepID=UPI0012B96150|nr:response regulator transcription factor [Planomicrobium sp. YIM 101495]MTD30534.1 response regulator [Planomicrobium sp. YIM 101495]
MKVANVMIVEDESGIREMTRLFLQKKGYEVMEATNGMDALSKLNHHNPDLILLDVEMPEMDGFELCKQIRLHKKVPILFVSGKKEPRFKVRGLEVGGDDYITKPFDFSELEARIRSALRRVGWVSGEEKPLEVLRFDNLTIHVDACELYVGDKEVRLFHKEFQLLLLLAENPNRVWTSEQLYDRIWGYYAEGDIQTVKVHVSNLRRKIEKDPATPKYIQTVRGFGYKFVKS